MLSWALSIDRPSGEILVAGLLSTAQAYGGFRPAAANYCGAEEIANLSAAFDLQSGQLGAGGSLWPKVLSPLAAEELTAGLGAYAERAPSGALDSPFVAGTAKDLWRLPPQSLALGFVSGPGRHANHWLIPLMMVELECRQSGVLGRPLEASLVHNLPSDLGGGIRRMRDEQYMRTELGLLVPRGSVDSKQPAALPDADLDASAKTTVGHSDRWLNLASIFIQLVTVVVLWLTFKNTVIPTQQKELLAEQVAGLEQDRKRTVADIEHGRRTMEKLNSTLSGQRQELSRLQQERNALEIESRRAHAEAIAAQAKEQAAQLSTKSAQKGLTDARWRIFSEEASWQILRADTGRTLIYKHISNAADSANSAAEKQTAAQSIVRDIELYEKNWPDYKTLVKLTGDHIRALRSPHYTVEMANEFADQFEKEGAKFQCERPNFATMKEKYLLALANAGKEASEEAKRQMDKIRREYAARGQTPVFQEGWEENATRMSLIGLEYSVKRDQLMN